MNEQNDNIIIEENEKYENFKTEINDKGSVKISNDVIAIIASIAANEVEGVVGMSGNLAGGITEFLGIKNQMKGVKVDIRESSVSVDISLIVSYGFKLNKVGEMVQKRVKEEIENMTELEVYEVNVNIMGIDKKTISETPI